MECHTLGATNFRNTCFVLFFKTKSASNLAGTEAKTDNNRVACPCDNCTQNLSWRVIKGKAYLHAPVDGTFDVDCSSVILVEIRRKNDVGRAGQGHQAKNSEHFFFTFSVFVCVVYIRVSLINNTYLLAQKLFLILPRRGLPILSVAPLGGYSRAALRPPPPTTHLSLRDSAEPTLSA